MDFPGGMIEVPRILWYYLLIGNIISTYINIKNNSKDNK